MRPESPSQPPAPEHSGVFAAAGTTSTASATSASQSCLAAALEDELRDSLAAARAARTTHPPALTQPDAQTDRPSVGTSIRELYSCLQTPLFPRHANRDFFSALQAAPNKVTLRAVLASPTALRELPHFLACIQTLQRRRIEVDVRFIVVRWEDLADARRESQHQRDLRFQSVVHTVRDRVSDEGFAKHSVTAIDVELNIRTGRIASPPDFKDWSDQTSDAAEAHQKGMTSRYVDEDLARDVAWITDSREPGDAADQRASEQRLIDLATRRAVAVRIANEFDDRPGDEDHAFAMMTSEPTRRLVKCYRPEVTVLNVAIGDVETYSAAS